jgi:hypothetical protein
MLRQSGDRKGWQILATKPVEKPLTWPRDGYRRRKKRGTSGLPTAPLSQRGPHIPRLPRIHRKPVAVTLNAQIS